MLKKITIMALAIVAVAAFAAPSAMAKWKHHGVEIPQNVQLQLTGNTKFQAPGVGSIDCLVTVQMTFKAGQTTGTITQYAPDLDAPGSTVTQVCKTGGFLSECQVHAMQPTGLPWVFHTGVQTTTAATPQQPHQVHEFPNRLDVTHGEVHYNLTGAFCPVLNVTKTAGTFELNPNQPNTFTSFQLIGNVTIHDQLIDGQVITANATVSGTNTVLGAGPHTYDV